MNPFRKLLIPVCFLLFAASSYGIEERYVMGKDRSWDDLSRIDDIRAVPGREGYQDLVLIDGAYTPDETTDLLMHFDPGEIYPHYDRSGPPPTLHNEAVFGDYAGVYRGSGTVLAPKNGSLFHPGTQWGDFTIEFWLYPSSLTEGETILRWDGARRAGGDTLPQNLRATISQGRVSWMFENFFVPPDGTSFSLQLTSLKSLIPRRWNHHLLRFDASTGLLEYLVDGETEGVTHANRSGRETGEVFYPQIGGAAESRLVIGSRFTGFLDEFRLSSRFVDSPRLETYPRRTGEGFTAYVDLGYTNTSIRRIESDYRTPNNSAIYFYYQVSDDPYPMTDDSAPWTPFRPNEDLPQDLRARWIRLRFEMFPDGTGTTSPSLSSLAVVYEPDLPPLPPKRLSAQGMDSSIRLDWEAVADEDVAGYRVYYGDRPGTYFGTDATQGASPIDVGNSTSINLEGLDNGKLYYFSVVSYDSTDPPHMSEFSREISGRPSSLGNAK